MHPMGTLKKLLFVAVAFFGSVITFGVITAPDDAPKRPATSSAVVAAYSHDQLQGDSNMTERMSIPNADTDAQYHRRDGQLDRSQSPGYVRALEQHLADIDRMLARGNP